MGFLLRENDLKGVQKMHIHPTPRIGGLSVFFGFSIGLWLLPIQADFLVWIWLASLPAFTGGLLEDLSARISPIVRLSLIFLSITIAFVWLQLGITSLEFEWTDDLLSNYVIISFLFTLLVVGGAVNSINIIDGSNGLMAGYSVLVLLAIIYIANLLGDTLIVQLSSLLVSSLLGFLLLNFPFGRIFMGDGGSYFVGFSMSSIGLLLSSRHETLSLWFVLLLFIYPMYESLFSIYRRRYIQGSAAMGPDALHLHSIIYQELLLRKIFKSKKTICNSMTSPILWLLSLIGIIPAVIWYDDPTVLIGCAFMFMIIYTIIYRYILNLKNRLS